MNLKSVINMCRGFTERHCSELLIVIGIAGYISTTILAVKATPKALSLIEAHKKELSKEQLTVKETVMTTWKCYIPATISGVMSTVCVLGSAVLSHNQKAALAAAYTLSETSFSDYKEKALEALGEKKEKDIRDKVAEKHITENPVSNNEVIITGKGDTLCYDILSGRYFNSDIEKIRRAENELNRRMRDELSISLNDFYDELGLDRIKIGDDLGWNIDKGYLDISFSSRLAENDVPCIVINHSCLPTYEF